MAGQSEEPSPLDWPIALAIAAIAGLGTASIADGPSIWAGWAPASCLPDACFCEAIRNQLVRQPVNTISSLGFIAPGIVILKRSGPRRLLSLLFGGGLVVVGLGSAFFHASLTFAGQTTDVFGMYLVAVFAVLAAAGRRFRWPERTLAVSYLAGNSILLALLIGAPGLRRYAFAALVLAAAGLELGGPRPPERRLLILALAFLAAGFAAWALDITRTVCAPRFWFQGHALWHLLTATSATLYFVHATGAAGSRPSA